MFIIYIIISLAVYFISFQFLLQFLSASTFPSYVYIGSVNSWLVCWSVKVRTNEQNPTEGLSYYQSIINQVNACSNKMRQGDE